MTNRVCLFVATREVLRELLQLPPEATIDAVDAPLDQPGTLRFRIRGIGPEVPSGGVMPRLRPTITRIYPDSACTFGAERVVIDWRNP